jgi:calmodulin
MAPEVISKTKELKITDKNIKRIMEELFGEQVEDLKKAFADMDIDNNGYVTENELKELLSRRGKDVNDPVKSEIMKICDVNGDGRINFAEFIKAASH